MSHTDDLVQEIAGLKAENKLLREALKKADAMLEYVGDPQCDGSGAYYDNDGQVYQCQWCADRESIKQALKGIGNGKEDI